MSLLNLPGILKTVLGPLLWERVSVALPTLIPLMNNRNIRRSFYTVQVQYRAYMFTLMQKSNCPSVQLLVPDYIDFVWDSFFETLALSCTKAAVYRCTDLCFFSLKHFSSFVRQHCVLTQFPLTCSIIFLLLFFFKCLNNCTEGKIMVKR